MGICSMQRRKLPVALIAAFLVLVPGTPAWAHNVPSNPLLFEMPFQCGQQWNVATYTGHGDNDHATDWNQGSGSADRGLPVVASYRGTVTVHPLASGDTLGPLLDGGRPGPQGVQGAGNYVVIDHGNGWTTRYLHLQTITVSNGPVGRGRKIGTVGDTGASGNFHLHYEQEFNGVDQHVTFHGRPIEMSYVYNGPLYRSHNCSDGIAAVRPSGADSRWYLDSDRNGSSESTLVYGLSSDGAIAGDWDGDGGDGVGVFRGANRTFYLDYDNDGGSEDTVRYGTNGDRPVAGDWNGDGRADVGVFRPSTHTFYLDTGRDGRTDISVNYGLSTDIPVAGDWNGDGRDSVGVFRPSNHRFYLDDNNNGRSDLTVSYGLATDRPVVGDWDGDGDDSIAVFRPSEGRWYLDYDNNGRTDERVRFGLSQDRVASGDWRWP